MIERWLQITCDACGETDTSTAPNMTIREYRSDLRPSGWVRRNKMDLCGMCQDLENPRNIFSKNA